MSSGADVKRSDFRLESKRLEVSLYVIKEPREVLGVGNVVALNGKSPYVLSKVSRLNRSEIV
jgi:hypothetical protein